MQEFSLNFTPWFGVVINRTDDPQKLGRCQVRMHGFHTTNQPDKIKNKDLFWALLSVDPTNAANSGIGHSPTGLLEGTTVWGYWMDGEDCQAPMIVGAIHGIPRSTDKDFSDPNGKYPKKLNESDVNKLALNERIQDTVVETKRKELEKDIKTANGEQWSEPTTPYEAEYPYNHVYESESGHIQEFDDTEGAERYHLYHKSGTFNEIHPEGDSVTKIKKKNYTIIEEDDHILIKGDSKITIEGTSYILIKGDAFTEIKGNKKEIIHGNYDLDVKGDYFKTTVTKGEYTHKAGKRTKFNAPRIDLN